MEPRGPATGSPGPQEYTPPQPVHSSTPFPQIPPESSTTDGHRQHRRPCTASQAGRATAGRNARAARDLAMHRSRRPSRRRAPASAVLCRGGAARRGEAPTVGLSGLN
uniref:Predicted protein n=1 Tax=Hordeum vulgare subsp. vulgare TaxID=112509 RepID=F2CVB9_HORVV|nr:predicted protein [Hordeum vulgare subsp. vulgare]